MSKLLVAAFTVAAMMAVSPAQAQPTPASSAAAPPAAAGLPAARHLVYQFGYNTKAASSGDSTGTTTIDIGGLAADGGLKITATDNWWNSTHPKQSSKCEVYSNGNVTCPQPPYNLTAIQLAVLPLLGQNYLTALAAGSHSNSKQSYNVKASFAPSATGLGFAGQVYTWNCAYTLTGKGTTPDTTPLLLTHAEGTMKQQGGRYTVINQKANILYDPRIKMPVFVTELSTFVPQRTTNSYSIELKLVKY